MTRKMAIQSTLLQHVFRTTFQQRKLLEKWRYSEPSYNAVFLQRVFRTTFQQRKRLEKWQYSEPSYNAVNSYRVIWKPRCKKLGINTNQITCTTLYTIQQKPSYMNFRNNEIVHTVDRIKWTECKF